MKFWIVTVNLFFKFSRFWKLLMCSRGNLMQHLKKFFQVEKLIAEAYSVIDKAMKVGTLHRNTGVRRKSRLAQRKKAVEIHHGWYTPAAAVNAV